MSVIREKLRTERSSVVFCLLPVSLWYPSSPPIHSSQTTIGHPYPTTHCYHLSPLTIQCVTRKILVVAYVRLSGTATALCARTQSSDARAGTPPVLCARTQSFDCDVNKKGVVCRGIATLVLPLSVPYNGATGNHFVTSIRCEDWRGRKHSVPGRVHVHRSTRVTCPGARIGYFHRTGRQREDRGSCLP